MNDKPKVKRSSLYTSGNEDVFQSLRIRYSQAILALLLVIASLGSSRSRR